MGKKKLITKKEYEYSMILAIRAMSDWNNLKHIALKMANNLDVPKLEIVNAKPDELGRFIHESYKKLYGEIPKIAKFGTGKRKNIWLRKNP